MVYASGTTVAVDKTRVEIEKVISKYGARNFGYMAEDSRAMIFFEANDRRIRFSLRLPPLGKGGSDQARRSAWRALLLVIKAKLESVESKIETFEEAFFAHVVMPGGQTVYEAAREQVSEAYQLGRVDGPLMLTGPQS